MKIIIVISLFFISVNGSAQTITLPLDSVKILLCHKWNVQKITFAGQPINQSFEHIIYEFSADNSFQRTIADKIESGTWYYDQTKKWITIKSKKFKMYLLTLDENEIRLVADKPREKEKMIVMSHLRRIEK